MFASRCECSAPLDLRRQAGASSNALDPETMRGLPGAFAMGRTPRVIVDAPAQTMRVRSATKPIRAVCESSCAPAHWRKCVTRLSHPEKFFRGLGAYPGAGSGQAKTLIICGLSEE